MTTSQETFVDSTAPADLSGNARRISAENGCPHCECQEKNISETHWLCGTHIATAARRADACWEGEVKKLRAALAPLASLLPALDVNSPDDEPILRGMTAVNELLGVSNQPLVTVGDVRRAYQLLYGKS